MAAQLSIVVPCYNEVLNLPHIFAQFDELLAKHSDVEIILVDNGSTDNSAKVFEEQLKSRPGKNFKLVHVVKNLGYGFGINSGLEQATAPMLSWTHADLQTDPKDVMRAWEVYKSSTPTPVLVKGFRKNRRASEAFFSWGMGVLSSMALGTRLTEINAQPKLFSRAFYESIKSDCPKDFSFDLYFLYHAKKQGSIIEIPVFFLPRQFGEAKGGSGSSVKTRIKLIKRIFAYVFEMRKKLKHG